MAILAGVAAALYPSLLPSNGDAARDITIYNAATGEYALRVGLVWWGLGMCLAFGYFVFVYRKFRGKVRLEDGHWILRSRTPVRSTAILRRANSGFALKIFPFRC